MILLNSPSKRSTKTKVHFILLVTIRKRFSLLQTIKGINFCLVKLYVTPLLDNIRFGKTLYRQIVGIPMGTNCAPLVADSFLYCFEDIS